MKSKFQYPFYHFVLPLKRRVSDIHLDSSTGAGFFFFFLQKWRPYENTRKNTKENVLFSDICSLTTKIYVNWDAEIYAGHLCDVTYKNFVYNLLYFHWITIAFRFILILPWAFFSPTLLRHTGLGSGKQQPHQH